MIESTIEEYHPENREGIQTLIMSSVNVDRKIDDRGYDIQKRSLLDETQQA